MNVLTGLVMTVVINGSVYQDIPHTFYSSEDCQSFIQEQSLSEDVFRCEQLSIQE